MKKNKISKSWKKHIRKEKSRIRREALGIKEEREKIQELLKIKR